MKKYLVLVMYVIMLFTICAAAEPENSETLSSRDLAQQEERCPENMIEVSGEYCPEVEQQCLNLDKSVHNVNGFVKCMEFAPTICQTPSDKRIAMHFCIDKYEFPNQEGVKPTMMMTWYEAKKNCENLGKRLCTENEWTLACEGPQILPYPYGYKRDKLACNIDHSQRPWFDASKSQMTSEIAAKLDQSVPAGSMPQCVSPYGVYDMTGNSDEWVVHPSGHPYISGLKGGHWVIGARNRCRPITLAHGPTTVFYEIGARCCQDATP